MLESQLETLLKTTIAAGIAAWPGPTLPAGIVIQKAFQPRQAGVPTAPTITFYHKGPAVPRGFPKFDNFLDPADNVFKRSETQRKESTYMVGALYLQDPANVTQITEVDLLEMVRWILQGQNSIAAFKEQDVGVLRISQIDSNYFNDDRGQNENNPAFNIVFTYKNVVVFPVDGIQGVDATFQSI